MRISRDFWAGRRVLITGHTGFKGAWLSLWLQALGADAVGIGSPPPTHPSLHELARVGQGMRERALDVRDAGALTAAVREAAPEVVLHLAAQPMVRRALADPAGTFAVNVMGTVNLLEAVRAASDSVKAVVVVTSDKCYENPPRQGPLATIKPFVESDPLGGADPYSASKACAELVAAAYRRAFFADAGAPRVATARAGNVIGGGDWGEDRLIADVVRAVHAQEPVKIRSPRAVRPWQHVLNPLSGYLLLAESLWRSPQPARAWNLGPPPQEARTVGWVVERLAELWDGALAWELDERAHPPEAGALSIDSGAAERELGWRPRWSLEQGLERLVDWHQAEHRGADMRRASLAQIEQFMAESPASRAAR